LEEELGETLGDITVKLEIEELFEDFLDWVLHKFIK
jgi:predicted RNA binding protein with dsRBD fold (UPF0201 family)